MKSILKKQFIFRNKTAIAGIGLLSLLSPFQAFAGVLDAANPLFNVVSFAGGIIIDRIIEAANTLLYMLNGQHKKCTFNCLTGACSNP